MTSTASLAAAPAAYASLEPICGAGLRRTLNPATSLFDRQLRDGAPGPTRGTEGLTSTAICLIGLHRAALEPSDLGLDPAVTFGAMLQEARRRRYPGASGLLIWANAVWDRLPLQDLMRECGNGLTADAARLTTMEAAWLLSGLLHELDRTGSPDTEALARAALARLLGRVNPATRLAMHAGPEAPLRERLRRNVANFADQIYTVQALSFAALRLGETQAGRLASEMAGRLVSLQGPLGQWWWHYDAAGGVVAGHYPVYAVHQHAMAPMALFAARAAGGGDYSGPLARGRAWLTANELAANLIDPAAQTIWRDIGPRDGPLAAWGRKAAMVTGKVAGEGPPARLVVNRETRPYEWAWLLYAAALERGGARGRHLL